MQRDVKSQLRITAWPEGPLPLPEAEKFARGLALVEGVLVPKVESLRRLVQLGSETASLKPSGETYLRLIAVDLDDPDAILAFANAYGPLGGALAYDSLQKDRDDFFKRQYMGQLNLRREWGKKRRALRRTVLHVAPRLATREAGKDDKRLKSWLLPVLGRIPPAVETLDEFRFAARCIRDLHSAWLMFKDSRSVTDYEWVSPSRPEAFTSVHQPASLLNGVLGVFLRYFSPQVGFAWFYNGAAKVEDLFRPADTVTIEPTRGPKSAPLYAICALELFNHIIENAEYHICANERCGRIFVYQQGRSEKGQRRSMGVLYCTPECARATAQRAYRHRRRQRVTNVRAKAGLVGA